jgi:putative tricarboxylic transport membrane protein
MAEESVTQESLVPTPVKIRNLLPTKQDWKDSVGPIARGTPIGFFIGILPGGGAILASFLSYGIEKRVSKHPEKFGTGTIEGVAGPETANNAAVSGAFIPLLTLGLPFNVITALLLAAFMVHGVIPGPMILQKSPEIFWGVVTSMYIGNIMLLILNIPLIGVFINILRIPYYLLTPLIAVICFVGAFSVNNNAIDVVIMLIFGLVGYLMRKFGYDAAPLILGYILGPMLEKSMRQSLMLSNCSIAIFFRSPISVIFLLVAVLVIVGPLLLMCYRNIKQAKK